MMQRNQGKNRKKKEKKEKTGKNSLKISLNRPIQFHPGMKNSFLVFENDSI